MTDHFYTKLPGRGLIHLEGEDRVDFLQGLVSNDMDKLAPGKLLYACLLSPQGKFLHDFFIHDGGGFLLLDCEGGERAQDLYTRLNRYRLRAKVQISVEEQHDVYAVFDGEGLADPRHPDMGARTFEKPALEEKLFEEWDKRRIALGIPDGSRDMQVERSTLIECNLDRLNAVDWDKGCYVGQELTARMHHRGLAKRHLYPVQITGNAPAPFTDIEINRKLVGNMRSHCGDIGLALLKDDALEELNNDQSPICLLG